MTNPAFITASRQNYLRLQLLRSLIAVVLAILLAIFHYFLPHELNYVALTSLLGVLIFINVLSWIRTHKPWPITDQEFFVNLLLDLLLVSALLYFSGGASNPFVSYFLVPLTISAATLPRLYTWCIAAISITAYGILFFFNSPLPVLAPHSHHGSDGLNLHLVGMWVNFTLSVVIISFFVVKMSGALKRQAEILALEREERLRDEQIIGIATVAAGTAHELGTPLSTIKTLVAELKRNTTEPTLLDDLEIVEQQVGLCADILQGLSRKADEIPGKRPAEQSIAAFVAALLEQWQILRPDAQVAIQMHGSEDTSAPLHPSLTQALLNLLNNAADAEPNGIQVVAKWDATILNIDIYDEGPGVADNVVERLGKPFIGDKGNGLGLGFFLSNATLSRVGGSVSLYERNTGGTHTQVTIPLRPNNNV